MTGTVLALNTYPIKGFSAQSHQRVALSQGAGFPGDRIFGLAKESSGFDPTDPKPLPKDRFIVLLEHAKLAGLHSTVDLAAQRVEIQAPQGARTFDLTNTHGQSALCAFVTDQLGLSGSDVPHFAQAAPHRFTDVSVTSATMMHAVSLINLTSVQALAAKAGVEIDPARFRGNILIEGWPPFAELDLVGQEIEIGNVVFKGLKRTRRCAATQVNPATAERDLDVPRLIHTHYGHLDMGLYLETCSSGDISLADSARIL